MNAIIGDVWSNIQLMANKYHNTGECMVCSEWDAGISSYEELQSQFVDITNAVVGANEYARLIKRVACICVLIDFANLCFRVGFYRTAEGIIRMFVDFEVNPANYNEYHLDVGSDDINDVVSDSDWDWFD